MQPLLPHVTALQAQLAFGKTLGSAATGHVGLLSQAHVFSSGIKLLLSPQAGQAKNRRRVSHAAPPPAAPRVQRRDDAAARRRQARQAFTRAHAEVVDRRGGRRDCGIGYGRPRAAAAVAGGGGGHPLDDDGPGAPAVRAPARRPERDAARVEERGGAAPGARGPTAKPKARRARTAPRRRRRPRSRARARRRRAVRAAPSMPAAAAVDGTTGAGPWTAGARRRDATRPRARRPSTPAAPPVAATGRTISATPCPHLKRRTRSARR